MKKLSALKLTLGFALVLALLGFNFWMARGAQNELIRNETWVTHTFEVLREIETDVSLAKDVETGARGYVLTGQRAFLEPFIAARTKVKAKLEPLYTMVKDNPPQQKRVEELSELISRKVEVSQAQINLVNQKRRADAVALVASGSGKAAMDAVRAKAAEMRAVEEMLLATRSARAKRAARNAQASLVISIVSTLGLLTLVYGNLAHARGQSDMLETQRDELQAHRDQLARKGAELEHALGELKRLEEMRDNLTAMLVHDLRTPLTTLIAPLQMLQADEDGAFDAEMRREVLAMSESSAQRLLGLVNELLDIAKMEAGEMSLRRESLNPKVVLDESMRHLNLAKTGGASRIGLDAPPVLPLLQADQELLTRVLINLLGNAEKFTPAGGKITLSARPAVPLDELPPRLQPAPDERDLPKYVAPCVLFSVEDSGEGIPPEDLDRVFEKFGQVEGRQAGRKMSTGLGLTFCKLAVEAHGGIIWVESEVGRGSSFRFTIPCRETEAGGATRGEQSRSAEAVAALS